MDFIEAYATFFLILNIANQVKKGNLYTYIFLSLILEIPILGRVFMFWWKKVFFQLIDIPVGVGYKNKYCGLVYVKHWSIFLYQMNYDKTDDIQDLIDIVDKTYVNQDSVRQEKYLDMLINREDFNTFCSTSDREHLGKGDDSLTTKEYYYGYYASVLYENEKFDKALEVANEFVKTNGYTEFNPLRTLLDEFRFKFTDDEITQVEKSIKDVKCKNKEQKIFKSEDLNYIKILKTIK